MSVTVASVTGVRRFRPYPEYKDSGVRWVGQMPGHWESVRTKFVARLESGHTPSRQHPEYWENCTLPWFGLADVWQIRDEKIDYVSETKERVSELGLANSSARKLPAGTVILSRTASVGFSAIMGCEMATTQDFANWVCGSKVMPKYLLYVLRAMKPEFKRLTMGSTHQTIYMPDIGAFCTVLPPKDEQRAIAEFLDRETGKIDALVAKKERLIELLQEKRTALITHAVTKGLDPTAPTKPSGIPWLGDIPAHWEVKPLKLLASLQTGITLGKKYKGETLEVRPYLRVANVQDGYLSLADIAELSIPLSEVSRYELRSGDVVVTEGGDFDKLGRGHVWEAEIDGCLHQNHIFAVRTNEALLDPYFLSHVTASGYGRAYFTATSKQSTNLASTNSTKLMSFPVPCPAMGEQEALLEFLRRGLGALEVLISKVRDGVSRLHEFRTALISAAVTGKIDVRAEVA